MGTKIWVRTYINIYCITTNIFLYALTSKRNDSKYSTLRTSNKSKGFIHVSHPVAKEHDFIRYMLCEISTSWCSIFA